MGPPTLATMTNIDSSTPLSPCDATQRAVNISWVSRDNAQNYTLTISNPTNGYTSTIHSLENTVTVLLPYGTYSANLCAINRCGSDCRDFLDSLVVECQSDSPTSQPEAGSPTCQPGTGGPTSQLGTGGPASQPGAGSPAGQPGTGSPAGQPGTGVGKHSPCYIR